MSPTATRANRVFLFFFSIREGTPKDRDSALAIVTTVLIDRHIILQQRRIGNSVFGKALKNPTIYPQTGILNTVLDIGENYINNIRKSRSSTA
jgi:hypothetical protein